MPNSEERRRELGDFLRGRRERLTPEKAGLPSGGRRRTRGLRREEVAILAGVSPTWYTFMEQARDVRASVQVLESLARALQLDAGERTHLFLLAHGEAPPLLSLEVETVDRALAQLLALLEPNPAYVTGRRWDVLAANRPGRALYTDWLALPTDRRNVLLWTFTASEARERLVEWEAEAQALLARFRTASGRYVEDPGFVSLIAELHEASAEFRDWWPRHDVKTRESGIKLIHHPSTGRMTLTHTVLHAAEAPEQKLVVYYPEPDTEDAARLTRLPLP
jgi:transcriptional regulator with XRE-family HTH domain